MADATLSSSQIVGPTGRPGAPSTRGLTIWVGLARRIVLVLIAFGLAQALLLAARVPLVAVRGGSTDPRYWDLSARSHLPVADAVAQALANSLWLLDGALIMGVALAAVITLISLLAHQIEGRLGLALNGLGRLILFSTAAAMVIGVSLGLVLISFGLRHAGAPSLPLGGMRSSNGGGPGDILLHLILPSLALALYPSILAARSALYLLTTPRTQPGRRVPPAALLTGMGALLGQVGGVISALVIVEYVFGWPGLGRLLSQSITARDAPVLLGTAAALTTIALIGALGAEIARGLARVAEHPNLEPSPAPPPWRVSAQRIWRVAALALLVIPIGLAATGLLVSPDEANTHDRTALNSPPSTAHLLGTDPVGRDVLALTRRGIGFSVGVALVVALATLIPAAPGGSMTGFLASHGTLLSESAADLLLLPADMLRLIPAIPLALVVIMISGPGLIAASVAVGLALLPRLVRACQALWLAAPATSQGWPRFAAGGGAALTGALFFSLWTMAAMDMLGLGVQPPTASAGSILGQFVTAIFGNLSEILWTLAVMWLCALVFFAAADALSGYFKTREMMARLNE